MQLQVVMVVVVVARRDARRVGACWSWANSGIRWRVRLPFGVGGRCSAKRKPHARKTRGRMEGEGGGEEGVGSERQCGMRMGRQRAFYKFPLKMKGSTPSESNAVRGAAHGCPSPAFTGSSPCCHHERSKQSEVRSTNAWLLRELVVVPVLLCVGCSLRAVAGMLGQPEPA